MNMHEFYLPDPTEGDLQKKKIIEQKKARIIELEKKHNKGEGTLPDFYEEYDEIAALKEEISQLENDKKETQPEISLAEMITKVQKGEPLDEKKPEVVDEKKPKDDKPPVDDKKPKVKKKLGVVKTDLMEKRSREVAAERMNQNKDELRGVGGFFKKIWKHNWMAEYYRAKEIKKVKGEMIAAGSTSTQGEDAPNREGDRRLKGAILDRFLRETPGLIHEVAGEWKDDLEHISLEKRTAAEQSIREAITAYVANSDFDTAEGNLTEAINRAYAEVFTDEDGNRNFEPLNIADNIKEYAREMRVQVENGIAVANLDMDFELTFGKAVTGARTEEAYTWRDKIIQKMSQSPVGRFLNETTIAAAVCAATAVASRGAQWGIRATVGAVGGGLVVGGGLAAMRESQAVKRDRAEHARAMASGRTFNAENSPRRREINETTYNMLSVRNAIDNLRRINQEVSNDSANEQQVIDLLALVGGVDARINISDRDSIDLLSYSSAQDMEFERGELDILRAEAKVAARAAYDRLGLQNRFGDFDAYCLTQTSAEENGVVATVERDIEAKDQTFEALRKRRRNGAFVKGAAMAGVAGLVFREAVHGGSAIYQELTEDPYTPSETAFIDGLTKTDTMDVNGVPHEVTSKISANLKVPEGFHVVYADAPGEYQIMEGGRYDANGGLVGGKVFIDRVVFDKDTSHLTPESAEALKKAGFGVNDYSESSTVSSGFTTETTQNLTPQEYSELHNSEFERSHRIGWADNNTKRFDHNELRLSDPKIGKDGNIRISMRGMKPHGSIMGNKHLNVPNLIKDGKMEIWISASQDSQFTPAHIPVGPDGTAVIDPNSAVGKLFKFDAQGHIIDRPRFTEAAAIMGESGGEKNAIICATDEGEGVNSFSEKVTVYGVKEEVSTKVVTDLSYERPETPDGPFIPIPFFIPRTPLEKTNQKENTNSALHLSPYYGAYSASHLEREMGLDIQKNNPNSYFKKEVDGKTVWVDTEGKEIKRDADRENALIKGYLEKQEKGYIKELELFEKNIGPMSEKCRVAINIPARFEERNLPNLLDQYVKQVDEKGQQIDKDLFEINIIVNIKEGEVADKSLEVVDEWKKNNPGYHVNVINIVFPKEKANVGMARKYVTDLTLKRSTNRPKNNGPLYIESEDADLFSVDKRTVSKLIKDFDAEPQLDILRGLQDRQPEILQKNDLLFFDQRMRDIQEIALRRVAYRPERTKGNSFVWNRVISGGWNTAYTAESYALIGGYVPDLMGEDMKIGQKISIIRGSKDNETGEYALNTMTAKASGLRASSSPRRFIDTMSRKIGSYDDFENQDLKHRTLDELLEEIKEFSEANKEQKPEYQRVINGMVQFAKDQVIEKQVGPVVTRVLWGMGLKEKEGHYLISPENNITLTDKGMDRIISLIKDYKDKGRSKLGYRRQNAPASVK